MKTCTQCLRELALTDFHRDPSVKDGLKQKCKICLNKKTRARYAKNSYCRESHLKRTFGISVSDYDDMMTKQDDSCAICNKNSTGNTKYFHVDHDHATGKVRGLLCGNCNRGLGMFQDSLPLLQQAIKYLKG